MLKKTFHLLLLLTLLAQTVLLAQNNDSVRTPIPSELIVNYTAPPRKYYIADIDVTGVEGTMYEDQKFVLVGFSGLSKGQEIQIPGDDITNAVKRFWRQGLFSDVKILQTKIEGDSVWLEIRLTDRPRVTDIRYIGMKKSEQEDIEKKIGFVKGNQITPSQIDRAETIIKDYFKEKGFGDAEVRIIQRPDPTLKNQVVLEVNVDKKEKLKVNSIVIEGNKALSDNQLKRAMKKTNEKGKIRNIFRSKKFVEDLYEADKKNIINLYQEKDTVMLRFSVTQYTNTMKKLSILSC